MSTPTPPIRRNPDPPPGFLMVISGPSGVGKSTLTNALLDRLDADLSVSMTTRAPSPSDVDGIDYHFVAPAAFEQAIRDDELLEHAVYNDNYYGTPRRFVQEKLDRGRIVILEIDVDGARQIKAALPGCFAIFIKAPTRDALLARLRGRQREDEETIQKRFSLAQKEIAFAEGSDVYDAFVTNDDFDRAVAEIESLVRRRLGQAQDPTLF
ncbi:MAG: guanylate kinase [Planctomycetota bacterium]